MFLKSVNLDNDKKKARANIRTKRGCRHRKESMDRTDTINKKLYSLFAEHYKQAHSEWAKKGWETRRKNELLKKQMEKVVTANNKERKQ